METLSDYIGKYYRCYKCNNAAKAKFNSRVIEHKKTKVIDVMPYFEGNIKRLDLKNMQYEGDSIRSNKLQFTTACCNLLIKFNLNIKGNKILPMSFNCFHFEHKKFNLSIFDTENKENTIKITSFIDKEHLFNNDNINADTANVLIEGISNILYQNIDLKDRITEVKEKIKAFKMMNELIS